MKLKLILPLLFFGAFVFMGCQKQDLQSSKDATESSLINSSKLKTPVIANFNINQFKQLVIANDARLSQLKNNVYQKSLKSISVPLDFPTIQEAVDAAADGANIFVDAGTYEEAVVVITPDLNIMARGNVQLNGGILILGADNVKIQKFNIDPTNTLALSGFFQGAIVLAGVTKGQIVQNTIAGNSPLGIQALSTKNVTIRDNNISGISGFAIIVMSQQGLGTGSSTNNTILNNIVTGTSGGSGIQLQGDADNNRISNNKVNIVGGAAIVIFSVPDFIGAPPVLWGVCESNLVQENEGTNSDFGFAIQFEGSNNTIGPYNTFSSNALFGIYSFMSSGNHYDYNTALDNGACDIYMDASPGNTFNNNTANCVSL